ARVLPDDRPARLLAARGGARPRRVRAVPQAEAHKARRGGVDRVEFRAGASEVHECAAGGVIAQSAASSPAQAGDPVTTESAASSVCPDYAGHDNRQAATTAP